MGQGKVYFVHVGNRRCVKIGFSTNLEQRLSSYRTGCAFVELLHAVEGPRDLEVRIHRSLSHARRTREIFDYDDHRVYYFIEYAKAKGIDAAFKYLEDSEPAAVKARAAEMRRDKALQRRLSRSEMDNACAAAARDRKQALGW